MCVEQIGPLSRSRAMFKAFDGWTDRSGAEKMSHTGFGLAMARKYTRKAKSSGNFYEGIRLKNVGPGKPMQEDAPTPAEAGA
jgi:hypothetical protein